MPARAVAGIAQLTDCGRMDRTLCRAMALERGADRRLGRALRGLKAGGRRYQRLGFVLWDDYVRERLGIELRWAQELEKLDRACERVPELGEALAGGALVKSKVLELFRVVGEGTPVDERRQWIERGRRLTVRQLRREVAEWKRTLSGPSAAALPDNARPVDPAETLAGGWMQLRVPMRVAILWHRAIEHVRRLSNSDLPIFRCLEHIVADRFSAIGWPEEASSPVELPVPDPPPPSISVEPTSSRTTSAPEDRAITDPWELDRQVQEAAELKKRVRQRLGELLQALAADHGWRSLGFSSLEHYAEERLGLHPRTVRRLIRFHQALAKHPALLRGYFSGELTYLQVLVLLRVVNPQNATAWAAWAAKRSFLDVERAVAYAEPFAHSRTMSALPPVDFRGLPRIIALESSDPDSLEACIRFWCPADLMFFIRAGLRSCRDPAVGLPLPDWRCLEILLHDFLEQPLDPALAEVIARHPEFDRDQWRCTVRICSRRIYLHGHHVKHSSQGGSNRLWNKTSLCDVHHIGQEHGTGAIRVSGRAPDELIWEIGRRPGGGPPLLRFYGDVKISDEPNAIDGSALTGLINRPEADEVMTAMAQML